MSILEEKVICPSCQWRGTVGDCEPDVDGDGSLGFPMCNQVVKTADRVAFDEWVDKRQRFGYNPAWNEYLIAEMVSELYRIKGKEPSSLYVFLRSVVMGQLKWAMVEYENSLHGVNIPNRVQYVT